MARIPLVEPATAEGPTREVFERLARFGPISNVMRVFASNLAVFQGSERFLEALYGAPRVSPRHRELACLRASQIHDCRD